MKIALAQLNYTIGDIGGNAAKIIENIRRAKGAGADLVIFAEQALCGTPAYDLLRKTTFLELCDEALEDIASECDGIAAIVGLPILSERGTYSAAAVIENREIRHFVTKKNITARREMGFLVSGTGIESVEVAGERVAVVVGDDFRFVRQVDRSVDTLISINAPTQVSADI